MSDFKKENNLMSGKGEEDIDWITVKGNHIPIKDGENPQKAIKNHFANKNKVNKTSFETQVDEVLSGNFKSEYVIMSNNTPQIFQEIGVPNKPMMITAKHTYLAINETGKYTGQDDHYHNLGKDLFKLIPKLLEKPFMVLQSSKNKDDLIAILNWYDNDKNILICPIRINGKGKYNEINISANIVKSVYGKKNIQNYISKNFTTKDILLIENKKIRDLSNR